MKPDGEIALAGSARRNGLLLVFLLVGVAVANVLAVLVANVVVFIGPDEIVWKERGNGTLAMIILLGCIPAGLGVAAARFDAKLVRLGTVLLTFVVAYVTFVCGAILAEPNFLRLSQDLLFLGVVAGPFLASVQTAGMALILIIRHFRRRLKRQPRPDP